MSTPHSVCGRSLTSGEGLSRFAVDDTAEATKGQGFFIDALANDTDPNDNNLTIISTTAASNGEVLRGDRLYYLPNSGYAGTDRFTYTISDVQNDYGSGIRETFPIAPWLKAQGVRRKAQSFSS